MSPNVAHPSPARLAWDVLTAPEAKLAGFERRHRARMLAALLLALLLADALAVLAGWLPPLALSVAAVIAPLYVLSRTRLYGAATAIVMLLPSIPSVLAVVLDRDHSTMRLSAALMWLALPIVLASLTFNLRGLVATALYQVAMAVALPLVAPDIDYVAVVRPLSFLLVLSTFVVIMAVVRQRDLRQIEQHAQELADSEERYRLLVEHSPDAIGIYSQGAVVYINRTALAMFRATRPEDLVGRSVISFVAPEDRQKAAAQLRHTDGSGEPVGPIVVRMLRLDGVPFDAEAMTIPVTYQGRPASQVVIRDITQRKQAEEEVLRLKELNENIVQNASEGIVMQDDAGRFTFVNPAAAMMLDYTPQELLGKHWTLIIPPNYHAQVRTAEEQHRRGQSSRYRLELKRRDGSLVPALISSSPVYEKGQVVGALAVLSDVTILHKVTQALRESEERYRTIIEGIEDGYFETDLAGHLTFFNEALCRISGYPPDELKGLHYRQYTDPNTADSLFNTFHTVFKTGKPARIFDMWIVRKNGTRCNIEASVTLIRDAKGDPAGFRGIARDVTDRRQTEEALQAAYESLQEIDALRSEMIQNISHEFRTPLTYILSYVDLLLDPAGTMGTLSETQRGSLQTVSQQAQRLQKLIDNFVTFHQVGERRLERERTAIDKLLEEVVADARAMAEEARLVLSLEIEPGLPPAMIDPAGIRQVMDNLLVNAVKFTPAGGDIAVRAWLERRRIYVSVADTGIGIAQEVQGKIFDRFYQVDGTTRRRAAGLGLGLAICKKIVEAHGGVIWVESTPGQGSTFTFTLPVAM